jgi:hypothetical protein
MILTNREKLHAQRPRPIRRTLVCASAVIFRGRLTGEQQARISPLRLTLAKGGFRLRSLTGWPSSPTSSTPSQLTDRETTPRSRAGNTT